MKLNGAVDSKLVNFGDVCVLRPNGIQCSHSKGAAQRHTLPCAGSAMSCHRISPSLKKKKKRFMWGHRAWAGGRSGKSRYTDLLIVSENTGTISFISQTSPSRRLQPGPAVRSAKISVYTCVQVAVVTSNTQSTSEEGSSVSLGPWFKCSLARLPWLRFQGWILADPSWNAPIWIIFGPLRIWPDQSASFEEKRGSSLVDKTGSLWRMVAAAWSFTTTGQHFIFEWRAKNGT